MGFHIARATEALLQEYYISLRGSLPTVGGARTWAKLTEDLLGGAVNKNTGKRPKATIGDQNLLEEAEYVGKSFRNPLIHPEHSLDEADGPLLLAACVGLCSKILDELA